MRIRQLVWVVMFGLLSLNCFNEPLAPVMPRWDVNLTLPLVNKLFTLSEWASKDTALLKVGAANQISYSKEMPMTPTYVASLLTLTPRDTSVQVKLGPFSIAPPTTRIAIDVPPLTPGATVPIPESTMDLPDVSTTMQSFLSVTLKSGTLALTIQNNLPVRMDLRNPLQLLDSHGNLVTTFTFNPDTIARNGTGTALGDLAGKTLDNNLRLTPLRFHTPGSGGTWVHIPQSEFLVATLTCSGLKATRAELAEIPEQRIADNDTIKLRMDDSTLVRELFVRSGNLAFNFSSRIDMDMWLKFRFEELQQRRNGILVAFEDSIHLSPRGSFSYPLNLANTRVHSVDGGLIRSLKVISSVVLPRSSGRPVTLSETDNVGLSVTRSQPIVVDSAVAVIKPTWVSVSNVIGVNLGKLPAKLTGQLSIPSAALGLLTASSVGFPADLYIRVGARKNAAGDSVFLQVPVSQRRLQPGEDEVRFDPVQVGQFLSQISGRLPDSLRIVGQVLVNPPDVYTPSSAGVGTIGCGCSLGGSVKLNIPMNLGVTNGIYADTIAIGDSTGDGTKDFTLDKAQLNDLNYGKLYVEIENGLPVDVGLRCNLLDRGRQNLLSIPQGLQPIAVPAASVDGAGTVVASTFRSTVIELREQEIRQFNPAEMFSYSASVNTAPGNQSVVFKTSDFVRVRVWTTMSYRVKK